MAAATAVVVAVAAAVVVAATVVVLVTLAAVVVVMVVVVATATVLVLVAVAAVLVVVVVIVVATIVIIVVVIVIFAVVVVMIVAVICCVSALCTLFCVHQHHTGICCGIKSTMLVALTRLQVNPTTSSVVYSLARVFVSSTLCVWTRCLHRLCTRNAGPNQPVEWWRAKGVTECRRALRKYGSRAKELRIGQSLSMPPGFCAGQCGLWSVG